MPEKPYFVDQTLPSLRDPVYTKYLIPLGALNASHLDIGPATGENITYSTSLGLKSMGIEYDHEYAIRIKQVCIQGTAEYLPFDRNSFDLVTLSHVLEHLPHYEETLSEIYRVLKPNGTFIVEVPNKYSLQELFNKLYTHFVLDKDHKYLGHCNYFTYSRLKRILEMRGFIVKDCKISGGMFHGTINSVIGLTLDILLKSLIHRRRQVKLDNQRIGEIQEHLNKYYRCLIRFDKQLNLRTYKFVEIFGFVSIKG
jgi:SAM-dependent methyltransferase